MPVNRFPTTLSYRWSSRGEPPAVRSPAGRHHCGPTSGSAGALPPYTNPLTITAGRWAIALHGPIARRDSTEELATRAVIGLDDPLAVMNALARVAGSHVVDVESEGLRMIRGNLTGTVRISWVVDGDTLLVGDRADYLADLVGDRPSALGLTARLLEPMGHPADRLPLWERVRTIPPGYGLHWRLGRAPRVLPWWTGHAVGQQSLTASAPAVLTALADAVHDLMTPPDESRNAECVLADLSGGLDSSTVAALAAGHAPGDVLALTIGGVGLNTDEKWARHLSDHQLFRDHVVRRWEDQPMVFDTLADGGPLTEEPCAAISSHSAIRHPPDGIVGPESGRLCAPHRPRWRPPVLRPPGCPAGCPGAATDSCSLGSPGVLCAV